MGSVEPAEVFRVVLILLVLPPMIVLGRRLRFDVGRKLLVAAFVAAALSFVVGLLDSLIAAALMDAVQHVMWGVAGLLTLAGIIAIWRAVAEERGR